MVNTCVVAYCKTGYKKRQHKINVIPEKFLVFRFPLKNPELNRKWMNKRDWAPTRRSGICSKYFEEKFLKVGKRATLRWKLQPVPSVYSGNESIPPSVMPTPKTQRKPPSRVTALPDQLDDFNDHDKISDFSSIDESLCPSGYKLQIDKSKAVFYKLKKYKTFDIPTITEAIVIDDDLHVKLFFSGSPIPLPPWFVKGKDCRLTKKSYLENFPPYIRSFSDNKATNIMDELQQIRYKKPDDRPKFTSKLLQLALMLRYTSLPAYRLLVKHFPLPSVSLLKRLSHGGLEPLKAVKLLLNERKIDQDVVLLTDEMYLQKELQFQQGKLIGCDDNGNLFKGIMTFMIVGVRKNFPFVVKAVPESKIQGKWLSGQIIETIQSLHEIGFHMRAVISDNHPSNVSAFNELFSKYGSKSHENAILHHSTSDRRTYLFYDSVHLLKNVRNNLLNSRQFIFPEFHFSDFISLPAGKISWKLLHSVFDGDE